MIINPFAAFSVSQGWHANHEAVDFNTPIGTEFVAPCDGVYRRRPSELGRYSGQAGIYGDIVRPDGSRIRFCHLSAHVAADGEQVYAGKTVIGRTGNTGYVRPDPVATGNPSAGAHMHTTGFHANGSRWNWLNDVSAIPSEMENEMFLAVVNKTDWYLVVPGSNKPTAFILDGTSGGAQSGLPVIRFTDKFSVDAFLRGTNRY